MTEYDIPHTNAVNRPQPSRHRVRRIVLTGVAGAVIVGGGGAYAYASGDGGTGLPAAPPSGAPTAPGTGAPAAPGQQAPKPQPHIDGTVKAVDGNLVTVTDPDGFTRSIKVSSSTTYDGVDSPPAVGATIHATGTVASDGTTLDATTVGAMPTPGEGGPLAPPAGAPGAPGQGGTGTGSGSTSGPAAPSAPSGAPGAPSSASTGSPSTGS